MQSFILPQSIKISLLSTWKNPARILMRNSQKLLNNFKRIIISYNNRFFHTTLINQKYFHDLYSFQTLQKTYILQQNFSYFIDFDVINGILFCYLYFFASSPKKSLQRAMSRNCFTMFSSRSFAVSGLTFMFLTYYELILGRSVRQGSNFFLYVIIQFSQHLLKKLSFLRKSVLQLPCQIVVDRLIFSY